MAEIDNRIRDIVALGRQRDKLLRSASTPTPGFGRDRAMTFPIGAAVLDLVTGQTGTVIDGKRENVIIPLA